MKSDQERVFVVVDPTASEHIALQRAIITARFRKPSPTLYIFVAVDSESIDTRATNDSLFKNSQWFEDEIHAPLKKEGLDYQIEISWSSEWQRSILKSANRFGADVILLPIQKKKKTHSTTDFLRVKVESPQESHLSGYFGAPRCR